VSCQDTTQGRQTEFDYFQQLLSSSNNKCCGPLTRIGFTAPTLSAANKALAQLNIGSDYLDNYSPEVLDSAHMSLEMCPKHWIEHARILGNLALKHEDELWSQLAYYVFRVVCLSNSWDYKEILNYTKSVINSKED
jgi:hypothetical protein